MLIRQIIATTAKKASCLELVFQVDESEEGLGGRKWSLACVMQMLNMSKSTVEFEILLVIFDFVGKGVGFPDL